MPRVVSGHRHGGVSGWAADVKKSHRLLPRVPELGADLLALAFNSALLMKNLTGAIIASAMLASALRADYDHDLIARALWTGHEEIQPPLRADLFERDGL
jgi:hypothetical protein